MNKQKVLLAAGGAAVALSLAAAVGGYFYIKTDMEEEYTRVLENELRAIPFVRADFTSLSVSPLTGSIEIDGVTVERDHRVLATAKTITVSDFEQAPLDRREDFLKSVIVEVETLDVSFVELDRALGRQQFSRLGHARLLGDLSFQFAHSDDREVTLDLEAMIPTMGDLEASLRLVDLDPSIQSDIQDLKSLDNAPSMLSMFGRLARRASGEPGLGEALVPARLASFEISIRDRGWVRRVAERVAYDEKILVALDEDGLEEVMRVQHSNATPPDNASRFRLDLHEATTDFPIDGGALTIAAEPKRPVLLFDRVERGLFAATFREDTERLMDDLNIRAEQD